jgi:hypothetical protein
LRRKGLQEEVGDWGIRMMLLLLRVGIEEEIGDGRC